MPKKKRKKEGFHLFNTRKSFKKEFKRQIKLAIIAAIGFTVAFAWRNAIYNSSQEIVDKFIQSYGQPISDLLTAIFITLLGVFIIFITSKLLRDK
tara:strand:- start:448 stop:732 length:285 start_codon:yes stop_codon:yes gene_type:complete